MKEKLESSVNGDKKRLDFLEQFVNEHRAIVLHDGNAKVYEHAGLGLRPGLINRTLRQAIDDCMGCEPSSRKQDHSKRQ